MKDSDFEQALATFPDVTVERIERIEGGWSSHTFLINGELVEGAKRTTCERLVWAGLLTD